MSSKWVEEGEDERIIAQRDECDSMSAIFAEDFALICRDPISYSIALTRPAGGDDDDDVGDDDDDVGDDDDDDDGDASRRPPPGRRPRTRDRRCGRRDRLALAVSYPPTYPDVAPTFRLVAVGRDDDRRAEGAADAPDAPGGGGRPAAARRPVLHPVQERAVLDAARGAIAATGGPCVYGCVVAAIDFVDGGGLAQAGLALIPDDCLARVLTFLVEDAGDLERACDAMPVFRGASTANDVWEGLCRRRWGGMWGYRGRWERTTRDFLYRQRGDGAERTNDGDDDGVRRYWMRAYEAEEADSTRTAISRDELWSMTFECRCWFSSRSFRNQPDNMRDVLPTGLRETFASDIVFDSTGVVHTNRIDLNFSKWEGSNYNSADDDGAITRLVWFPFRENYTVHRTANWGWELRGFDSVLRTVDDDADDRGNHRDELWEDLTRNIIVQERPGWVRPTRFYDYNFREIPDDEDCKSMLGW
jgi:hypothetical protein